MNLDLSQNMLLAWQRRADTAERDLNHATAAPALFKPSFIERRRADFAHARAQMRRWV